jgi:hypothetical protein
MFIIITTRLYRGSLMATPPARGKCLETLTLEVGIWEQTHTGGVKICGQMSMTLIDKATHAPPLLINRINICPN